MNTYSDLTCRAPAMWDRRPRLSVRQSRTNVVDPHVTRPMIACAMTAHVGAHGCASLGTH